MHNSIFKKLKEDISILQFAKTKQTTAIDIDFFSHKDARKQLEKFSLNFSSCIPFPSGLAICSQRHLFTVSVF